MRFEVYIDDKVWGRFAKRLQARGLRGDAATLMEQALSAVIGDDHFPRSPDPGSSSTMIMLTLGRIVVRQVPDPPGRG